MGIDGMPHAAKRSHSCAAVYPRAYAGAAFGLAGRG
jgi:hypothetical protein